MTFDCTRVRRRLDAFVDGELTGADRAAVSQHLSVCSRCADAQRSIQAVGELLRDATAGQTSVDLSGLASGVVSRVRAEEAQSWRATFDRAVEDWHWAFVGVGSIVAACVSLLVASGMCWLGPKPDRDDSLAALLNNLGTPAGTLFIMATPVGDAQNPVVMEFDNGEKEPRTSDRSVVPAGFIGPSSDDLVVALSEAMVSPDGRMSDLRSMSRSNRKHAEALLDELQRLRSAPQASWSGGRVSIKKLGLVTNTSVTAKAL